ncbi:hypothetical protein [Vibrio sp. R78045]|uniref:hypothetical protein n=1 Tax=Vibrio sp. R78045 TaxID=3093868 RepID=UPI0036F2398E
MHDWELEFSSSESLFEALKESRIALVKERSKNAYIRVTGKSIADIQFDGIQDMLSELGRESGSIQVELIEQYADKLTRDIKC